MKKFLSIALALVMVLSLAACGGNKSEGTDGGSSDAGSSDETVKVALVLSGDINDGGWCQSAYEGFVAAGEEYGLETAYSESVNQPDFESTIREYAANGYNLVICVGSEFADACTVVAPEFPEVMFADFNGNVELEPNLASYRYTTTQTGFAAGVIAGTITKSNKVAYLSGSNAAHFQDSYEAFKDGAKYINPDIEAEAIVMDTFDDVALAQETAQGLIDKGYDVLLGNANTASLGVIAACEESGIMCIGIISDQYSQGDCVKVSVVQDNATLVQAVVKQYIDGEFKASINLFGMNEGAIYVSDWHGHDSEFTEEQIAQINEAVEKIADGSLKEEGILRKTSFE